MKKSLVCIGDSNTYGYDPSGYFGSRYPQDERWTGLMEQWGWRVHNYGQNGMVIPSGLWMKDLVYGVAGAHPDVVTVMLGSNDLLQGAEPEDTAERMESLLTALVQALPGAARVVLIAPPPMEPGTWLSSPTPVEASERLRELYGALGEKLGLLYADAGDWGIPLGFDGVHFTREGHALFARRLDRMLAEG